MVQPHGTTAKWAALLLLAAAALGVPGAAHAEEPYEPPRPSHNMFGMTGLIDTPTADMQPDGQISITSGFFDDQLRTTLSAQFLPGVEAAFRYSFQGQFFTDGSDNFDRSFDVKIRIISESERWPALAIGLQDFLGTGIYSGEYIVATKGFDAGGFGHLRFSGGIGWGRFASGGGVPNIFRGIDAGFRNRVGFGETSGTVNFGQFFRGDEMGFFGGIEWLTPIDDLRLKVEYSADNYARESRFDGDGPDLPINVGLEYRPTAGIEIGAYYMYGDAIGVRLSLSGNPFRPLTDLDAETAPQPLLSRAPLSNGAVIARLGEVRNIQARAGAQAQLNDARLGAVTVHTRLGNVRWADALLARDPNHCPEDLARAIDGAYGTIDLVTFKVAGGTVYCTVALRPAGEHAIRITSRSASEFPVDWYENEAVRAEVVEAVVKELDADGIGLYGIEIGPRKVAIYIENRKYYANARAIGRTARALTRTNPASIERFEITPIEGSLAISTIILKRSQLEEQVNRPDAARRAWLTAKVTEAGPVPWDRIEAPGAIAYPRFRWFLSPATPFNLFDPDQPVRFDLSIVAGGSVEFMPGLSINTAISKRLFGQLDDISRQSNSQVPNRVRSEIAQYLRDGDPALVRLSADYVTKIGDDGFYARVSAGYLERMFAGISTEVLWKPVDQSWGLGLELNYVKQRGFDTLFDFQDYSVITGHASAYWNTGYYGLYAQVDAGRYLAEDWGATFTLKRKFSNGWEFGGFFTLTDIPFSQFGEGSFDKGLFLTIPFNWIAPFETRGRYPLLIRPLTRDGGQRLDVSNRLWGVVESADERHLRDGWEDFWE